MKKRTKKGLIAAGVPALVLAALLIFPFTRMLLYTCVVIPVYEYAADDFADFREYEADYETAAGFLLRETESGDLRPGDRVEFNEIGVWRVRQQNDGSETTQLAPSAAEQAAFGRLQASMREPMTVRIGETDFRFYVSEAAEIFDELVYTCSGKRPENADPGSALNTFYRARHKTGNWWVLHSRWDAPRLR